MNIQFDINTNLDTASSKTNKKEHYSQILRHLGCRQIKFCNKKIQRNIVQGFKWTNLNCGRIKFCKENIQKVVKGSKLTNIVDLEEAVSLCIRIFWRKQEDYQ